MKTRHTLYILVAGSLLLLGSCTNKLPNQFVENGKEARLYPDYTNIEIPVNIAPLNFRLDEEAEKSGNVPGPTDVVLLEISILSIVVAKLIPPNQNPATNIARKENKKFFFMKY